MEVWHLPHRVDPSPPGYTARPGRYTNTGQGLWTRLRSCSSCSSSPSRTCSSPRFSSLDRVRDIPVVPQKGDSTVQSLNKVVDAVVYDSCPWYRQCRAVAFTDKVVDIPGSEQWKCLRFSHRQISMTISRRVWPIFRTHPKGVESPGCADFSSPRRCEEFFVVEGSRGAGVAGSFTPR